MLSVIRYSRGNARRGSGPHAEPLDLHSSIPYFNSDYGCGRMNITVTDSELAVYYNKSNRKANGRLMK